VPGQFEALEVVFVTGPSVTVSPEPMVTGVPCVAVVVGAGCGATLVSAVGDGLADFDADGAGAAFEVAFAVALEVGFAVEPGEVPPAATADARALAAAESAGAEAAPPGDEIGALGNALDAAAAAGPDDAALLLCAELEHPERASAATIVTPINPVRRIRTVMAFPPAGMRPTIDDPMMRGARSQNFATFHPMCLVNCWQGRVCYAVWNLFARPNG
jgi:hypothetical protein